MNTSSIHPTVCEVLLVRHGRTAWNVKKQRQSHRQVPLDEVGRAMAEALVTSPAIEHLAAIYTSDLARAVQTAEPVAKKLGLPVRKEMRLREVRGTPAPSEEYPNLPFPVEQETHEQVRQRAGECIEEIAANHRGQRVMVVSHGGTTTQILKMICGEDPPELAEEYKPPTTNTAINHLRCDGEGVWSVTRFWDIDHLAGFDLSVTTAADAG